MERNGFIRTWIYTLDRNIVKDVDFISEDEVTGIHTPSGSMQSDS